METFGKKVGLWPKEKLWKKVAHKEALEKSWLTLEKGRTKKNFDKEQVHLLEKKESLQKRLLLQHG